MAKIRKPDPYRRVKTKWKGCERCGLCKERKRVVIGRGATPADILFIGEAPGKTEDATGKPFFGRSGNLLNAELEQALRLSKLERKPRFYITNVVACRPPENRDPTDDEAWACWPRLRDEHDIVQPQAIIMLGRVAERHCRDCWTNTYHVPHPAWVLRQGGKGSPPFRQSARTISEIFDEELAND